MISGPRGPSQPKFYGKYRGVVIDVEDPEGLGRIKVQVPPVYGDEDSGWALPCAPFGGPDMGVFMLPEVDANVWVEFEQGDPSFPIWCGGWWSTGSDVPSGATWQQRIIKSATGHSIVLDDDADEIRIEHSGGAKIVFSSDGILIDSGGQTIALSSSSVSVNDGALEVT